MPKYHQIRRSDLWEELANAIILLAVKDWRKAVKTLKKRPWLIETRQIKNECEQFFLSDWFCVLTKVDGPWLLDKLREEADYFD